MAPMQFMKFYSVVFGLIAACAFTSIAVAGGDSVQATDGDTQTNPPALFETRYIFSGHPEKTTSKCIGNPVTPLCAAETKFAATLYNNEPSLGAIAYGQAPGVPNFDLKSVPARSGVADCYQLIGYWYHYEGDESLKKIWLTGRVTWLFTFAKGMSETVSATCSIIPSPRRRAC